MTAAEWIRQLETAFSDAHLDSPRLEAEMLVAHVLGVSREWLIAHPEAVPPKLAVTALAERRIRGEPMAYVLGKKEFFGREFLVRPGVLIPRPETELLVECALRRLPLGARVADIGTGSGVIGVTLALERQDLRVTLTDVSAAALQIATANAERHSSNVAIHEGDLLEGFQEGSLDAIVANLPYVDPSDPLLDVGVKTWEPAAALFAEGGVSVIERLVAQSVKVLSIPGLLILEFGHGQSGNIEAILRGYGYAVEIESDLAGIPRVAIGTRQG